VTADGDAPGSKQPDGDEEKPDPPPPPPSPSPDSPDGTDAPEVVEGIGPDAPPPPRTCCPMRRKVVVGILGVLPEQQCGVGDAELADFLRFDLQTPDGKPVLAFRYCPWCGAARGPDTEFRIVDVGFVGNEEGEGDDDEDGFEPPSSSFDPPSFGPRPEDD
jgi:hypothetical protein